MAQDRVLRQDCVGSIPAKRPLSNPKE
jgi:hypothetical protein